MSDAGSIAVAFAHDNTSAKTLVRHCKNDRIRWECCFDLPGRCDMISHDVPPQEVIVSSTRASVHVGLRSLAAEEHLSAWQTGASTSKDMTRKMARSMAIQRQTTVVSVRREQIGGS